MDHDRFSSFGSSRRWIYRDPARGKVAGVCAGIGEYLGIDPFLIRLGVVVSLFVFGPFTLLAYIVAVLALPVRDGRAEKERFWQTANECLDQVKTHFEKHARKHPCGRGGPRTPPPWSADGQPAEPAAAEREPESLDDMKKRLRDVDKRVGTIEAYVASREFGLSQAIRDLEK